nr:NUDIX hydrolase [Jannaschia aquimarina]
MIRDAATIVLLRKGPSGPSVLMGQRGSKAAFMPSKFVFPGGAVDAGDAQVPLARPLAPACRSALARADGPSPEALAAAAIRELAEETGQILGRPGPAPAWPGFEGHGPDAGALRFIFRAITPPGRPRRFDARFFLADAGALASDPDRLDPPDAELSHLQWVPLHEARALDMPFVTEVVLAEAAAHHEGSSAPGVPFFDNGGPSSVFRRL